MADFTRAPADEQDGIVDEYRVIGESPGVVGGEQLQPVDTATTVRVQGGQMLLSDANRSTALVTAGRQSRERLEVVRRSCGARRRTW